MYTRGIQWPVVLRVGLGTSGGVAAVAMAEDGGSLLAVPVGCPSRPDHLCRQAPSSPPICYLRCSSSDIVLPPCIFTSDSPCEQQPGDQDGKRKVGRRRRIYEAQAHQRAPRHIRNQLLAGIYPLAAIQLSL